MIMKTYSLLVTEYVPEIFNIRFPFRLTCLPILQKKKKTKTIAYPRFLDILFPPKKKGFLAI